MRKILSVLLIFCMLVSLAACGGGSVSTTEPKAETAPAETAVPETEPDMTNPEAAEAAEAEDAEDAEDAEYFAVREIMKQAQTMSMEELAAKAIAETNGGHFAVISDDETVRIALDKFIKYLSSLNSHYAVTLECDIAEEEAVLNRLAADSVMAEGKWSVVLVSDGMQTYRMMKDRQVLNTFVPAKWMKDNGYAEGEFSGYLPVVTKVDALVSNCSGKETFNTCWDFVSGGRKPFDIPAAYADNFLIMLTRDDNAAYIRESFENLGMDQKKEFKRKVDEMVPLAKAMDLGENGAYALAWIKLWVSQRQEYPGTDAILKAVSTRTGENECGLVDYSAIAMMMQTTNHSTKNFKIAAYEPVYNGFGGFAHSEYAFVTNNAATPWMACAFIAYITTTQDGFSAWGHNPGFYTGNYKLAEEVMAVFNHDKNGYSGNGVDIQYPAKNDKGGEWWHAFGKVVEEDMEYIDTASFIIGSWLKTLN